ncbi:hypothetical protein AB0M39_37575 [Streptomyces sp. NPDC051907]|uniref:hypothetical protein n=1 Tax=Streptomyces sp. NPDC051907 TaxID=3155284 RepID=UPI003446CD97
MGRGAAPNLDFTGLGGKCIDYGSGKVTVEPGQSKTFEVEMATPKDAARVRECQIGDVDVLEG